MPQRRFILSCAESFLLVLASASYAADMPAEVTINPMPEVPASPPADAVATPAPEAVSSPPTEATTNAPVDTSPNAKVHLDMCSTTIASATPPPIHRLASPRLAPVVAIQPYQVGANKAQPLSKVTVPL